MCDSSCVAFGRVERIKAQKLKNGVNTNDNTNHNNALLPRCLAIKATNKAKKPTAARRAITKEFIIFNQKTFKGSSCLSDTAEPIVRLPVENTPSSQVPYQGCLQ